MTRDRFCVRVADEQLGRCFAELVHGLETALRSLGRYAFSDDESSGRVILLGASPSTPVPEGAVLYETEQLTRPQWHIQRPGHVVWTFSEYIAAGLRVRGIGPVVHCPIGWNPLAPQVSAAPKDTVGGTVGDIDVLFYGSVCDRRREVIAKLRGMGLIVVWPSEGVFGEKRDQLIARSKVVLNMHYYESAAFEMVRVAHLLQNRCTVVSEGGGADPGLEDFAARATSLVPHERLAEECARLVFNRAARVELAERGCLAFSQLDFRASVSRALEQTDRLV